MFRPGRSCTQCAHSKRKCANTEAEARRIRVAKRKGREEDGTEEGRSGRRRRLEKGKEKETEETEEAEVEWRKRVEVRVDGLERAMVGGFQEILGRILELVREVREMREELVEVKELVDSRGLMSEGSEVSEEEDGEGEEEDREEEDGEERDEMEAEGMVGGGNGEEPEGGGAKNGEDVEMVE